jgi:hypothetical protein
MGPHLEIGSCRWKDRPLGLCPLPHPAVTLQGWGGQVPGASPLAMCSGGRQGPVWPSSRSVAQSHLRPGSHQSNQPLPLSSEPTSGPQATAAHAALWHQVQARLPRVQVNQHGDRDGDTQPGWFSTACRTACSVHHLTVPQSLVLPARVPGARRLGVSSRLLGVSAQLHPRMVAGCHSGVTGQTPHPSHSHSQTQSSRCRTRELLLNAVTRKHYLKSCRFAGRHGSRL